MKSVVHVTRGKEASSLVTTLLVLVVLSTIVVAFMQSMSVERMASKSVKNTFQAEEAAQSGIDEALLRLVNLMTNAPHHAITYTNVGNQNLTAFYGMQSYQATAQPTPTYLISTNAAAPLTALDATNSIAINRKIGDPNGWVGSPVGTNGAIVSRECRAPWVYILADPTKTHQPNRNLPNWNPYVARYAYWIEDETSKIDFRVAGNNLGPGGGFLKSTNSVSPADIDLSAAPLLNGTAIATNNLALNNEIIKFRNLIQDLPADSLAYQQVPGLSTNAAAAKFYMTAGSYASELTGQGRKRVNVNAIVTSEATNTRVITADLDDIIFVITGSHTFSGLNPTSDAGLFLDLGNSTNGPMPNFGNRFYPGVTDASHKQIYLKKIAANIRDYIDTDSQPTVVESTGAVAAIGRPNTAWSVQPQAIGKEAIPYFQEHAWAGYVANWSGSANEAIGTVEADHYLEFFNPSTKDWVAPLGTFIKIYDQPGWTAGNGNPSLDPDDFELDISNVVFPAGRATVITTNPGPDPPGLIQVSSNVVRKTPTALSGGPTRNFVGYRTTAKVSNELAFIFAARSTTFTDYQTKMLFGGPLGRYDSHPFISMSSTGFRYDFKGTYLGNRVPYVYASSMRGNDESSRSGDPRSLSEQLVLGGYNVGGNDTTRFFGNLQGNQVAPGSSTFARAGMPSFTSPTTWPDYHVALNDTANTAYAVIRDGPMESIGELGNIYDPRRVAGGGGINYARGGGRTLKIGQRDDVVGPSRTSSDWQNAAWRLTDIFSADTNIATVLSQPYSRGKININSVTRDDGVALKAVLRQFNFQAAPNSDPVMSGRRLSDTDLNNIVTSVKTYISNNGPLMERGELSQISYFQNGSPGGANIATSIDRGREEIFRRMVELITTRSAAFSIYSVGEAISENNDGRITKIAQARVGAVYRFDARMSGNTLLDKATSYTPVLLYEKP